MNGLAIVALAIIFDRVSQRYGQRLQATVTEKSMSKTKLKIENLYKIFGPRGKSL